MEKEKGQKEVDKHLEWVKVVRSITQKQYKHSKILLLLKHCQLLTTALNTTMTRYVCVKVQCGYNKTVIVQTQTCNKDSSVDIRIAFLK